MDDVSRTIMPSLIGNEKIKSILSSEFSENKPMHAYIISGERGSGKHTLARLIAASFVCTGNDSLPCGKCPLCRKIIGDISVDVLYINNGDKATIGVDAIRQIKQSLYITPNDSDKKFYIIENAHLMTPQAQNALLLSLEEPPPYAVFLLLCEDTSLLLETIRSRAPALRMESFDAYFIEGYLRKKYGSSRFSNEKAVFAAHLANGSLGRAADLYEHGEAEMKLYTAAKDTVRALLIPKKSEALIAAQSVIQKDRQSTCRVLTLARIALRDIIADKKSCPLMFYGKDEGVPDFAKKVSVKHLIELISALTRAENDISANCSQSTVMTSLILNS